MHSACNDGEEFTEPTTKMFCVVCNPRANMLVWEG